MLKAYYSLIQVRDVEPGVGVTVQDMLRGETAFVVDVGFSTTARPGLVMATRLVPDPEGEFLMTGGAALPVSAAVEAWVKKELKRTFAPETDFAHLTPQQEATLAALVIRRCLASPQAAQIAYAEPGQLPAAHPLGGAISGPFSSRSTVASPSAPEDAPPARVRANRNDPCPCGSGRKYKSCCGKR
jgi:hypothetical protein